MSGIASLLLLQPGCSSRGYVNMALDADDPDVRREGVAGLAASRDANTDWAVKVYDTIARTDTNTAVRRAAINALAVSGRSASISTIIKILKTPEESFDDLKPAPPPLRWEAAKAAQRIVRGHLAGKADEQEFRKLVLDRLDKEKDRNVRLVYVETLAMFPQKRVAESLIELLSDEDFAIVRAAERSLIALTGVTHHHDSQQWRDWLAKTRDPFAKAGQKPIEADVKSKSNWD